MARPALVVGLGGTGQWVLTWLKRDLLLSNNGQLPKNIRLLSVDTSTMLEAGTKRVTSDNREEEGIEVGGVTLDKGEFVYIGGDSKPLAERVKSGKLPQIGQWYHAQRWLDSQVPAAFVLDDGAGRIRQFGRMAVFKDLLGQEANSELWKRFQAAIDAVRSSINEQRRLEIIVVGSFAGGTGSGMFLDIALVLRMLAQQRAPHHILRGFFALPGVFTAAPDRDMKARTFSAWRELNRFMVIDSDFPMPAIEYVENKRNFRIEPTQRIFDGCYLVDGTRGGQPLAEEAKFGVFPMMSEVISAILDEEAGAHYTRWVTTNLAKEYAIHPTMPMYSALGAYTIQVPVHFVQEISSIEFGQNILLHLLKPSRKADEYGRLQATGAERHLALAAIDQNFEDRGFSGRQRSRSFMRQTISYGGETAKPTQFLGRVADLLEQSSNENRRAAIVNQMARAGGSVPGQVAARDSWSTYFPDLGGDPTFEALASEVNIHMRYNVLTQFTRRKGETAEEARARFNRIPEDIRTRFGGITSSGQEAEDFYGECGESLKKLQTAHLGIFRRLTRLKVTELLMGQSDNPLEARGGKLGYAWDYFDGVCSDLSDSLDLLATIYKERERIKPQVKLEGLSTQARKIMEAQSGRKIFWFWSHPKEKMSEDAYLQAQQRVVDLRREDVLHTFVRDTIEAMKDIAVEARDMIRNWIWHLASGDDTSNLPGLWDKLHRGKQDLRNAHAFDTQTRKVQRLLQEQSLPTKETDLAQTLSRWQWVVSYAGQPLQLQLQVRILPEMSGGSTDELRDPTTNISTQVRREIGQDNYNKLLNLAKRNFTGVVARSTVAQAIKEEYLSSKDFAEQVATVSAEPMFNGDPEATPKRKSNLIRVQANNDGYFTGGVGVEGELRYLAGLPREQTDDIYGIQVVGSEHPYKLTLVRTDDLYDYHHFQAWHDCIDAYAQHVQGERDLMDPILLHNFPAEIQAVSYERRLVRSGEAYRPLHPRVVMLLEDPTAFRQFLYLAMLGNILPKTDDNNVYRWELNWEKSSGKQTFWLTKGWKKERDEAKRNKPDIFSAMHGYIIHRQTQQEARQEKIDVDFADRLIVRSFESNEEEIEALKTNLEGRFMQRLRTLAYDADVSDRVVREDYRDLMLVAEMILKSRLEDLEAKRQTTNNGVSEDDAWFDVRPKRNS